MNRENFLLHDYTVTIFKNSQYVSGKRVIDRQLMVCPVCENKTAMPDHSEGGACKKCGINYEVYGNRLQIWK